MLLQPTGTSMLPNNPFVIGKSIEQTCGKIESANTEENGTKYALKTRSVDQARKLLAMTKLIDGFGTRSGECAQIHKTSG